MSMEHKAFVFDTKKFHAEIEPVMKDPGMEGLGIIDCGEVEEIQKAHRDERGSIVQFHRIKQKP